MNVMGEQIGQDLKHESRGRSLLRLSTVSQHLASSVISNTRPRIVSHSAVQNGTSVCPQIIAEPRVGLYDDKIKIVLNGFSHQEKVTLHGQIVQGSKSMIFASCGLYVANETGSVDIQEQESLGGTYTGVEPMGIIWSLRPAPGEPEHTRMAINFTNRPTYITLQVYQGHLNLEDIYKDKNIVSKALSSIMLERWFMASDVHRIEIAEGSVRGVLFLPPGEGPFQGVIDLFGSSGGIIEYRAALLASRGFAVLSLPYFRYKDLPKDLGDLTFDYFEEALNWFAAHPKVYKNGIGVIATSKGVEFAQMMAAFSPLVKALVSINGQPFLGLDDLTHKGKLLYKAEVPQLDKAVFTNEGLNIQDFFPTHGEIIPSWQNDCKHLAIFSGDDFQIPSRCCDILVNAHPPEKQKNLEILKYPGAGHLLEPPYNALCRTTVNKTFGVLMLFGGYPKEHSDAQEDSWPKILAFLRKHIPSL